MVSQVEDRGAVVVELIAELARLLRGLRVLIIDCGDGLPIETVSSLADHYQLSIDIVESRSKERAELVHHARSNFAIFDLSLVGEPSPASSPKEYDAILLGGGYSPTRYDHSDLADKLADGGRMLIWQHPYQGCPSSHNWPKDILHLGRHTLTTRKRDRNEMSRQLAGIQATSRKPYSDLARDLVVLDLLHASSLKATPDPLVHIFQKGFAPKS